MTKLDGQFLDHYVPDDWQEYGIWDRRHGFWGIIKDGVLYPFRYTKAAAEARAWSSPDGYEVRPLPDNLPRLGGVEGA